MKPFIVLDSGPLGLLMQRKGVAPADRCRAWLAQSIKGGARFIVPEIADYEVRRELIRLGATSSLARLDRFEALQSYLPLTTRAMRLAAELWAKTRAAGLPTADRHALDADVILAAQTIASGVASSDFVVASTNPVHIRHFVEASLWADIV